MSVFGINQKQTKNGLGNIVEACSPTLQCIKVGIVTLSAFSAMGFKGNSFNGQLQTITKLFNGTLQCYESALLLQKCWFLFFGKNPFPLLINKSCVPNTAQRPKTTVSLCRAGVFRSHCCIQILSWRQRKKERKKMLPHMFSFLLSKTHFLFFPVCFSVQNFKVVETG